jgi:hypothetical protein
MTNEQIVNWQQFTEKIRSRGCKQLKELDNFPDSVLITGCQRSGTTILARIIRESEGMVDFWSGKDDELEGALILSGYLKHVPKGRYCFQTTFLDGCYPEYYEHDRFKLLWVLRNPYSTIYSLLNNWSPNALHEVFNNSINLILKTPDKQFINRGVDLLNKRLIMACRFYNWKVSQLFELFPRLGNNAIMVIDYDELVLDKDKILPKIYKYIDLPYKPIYGEKIHSASINKKKRLSLIEKWFIKKICENTYMKSQDFIYPQNSLFVNAFS